MTDADLDAIEQRANRPLRWSKSWEQLLRNVEIRLSEVDAATIAAVRADVIALLAEVRRLRALAGER